MIKQIGAGAILVVITTWLNQLITPLLKEELESIHHFQRQNHASLSLTELPGSDFKMFDKKDPIDHLSMTTVYIAKTTGKHLKNIRLTFKVKEDANNPIPKMISADMTGPKGYDEAGIKRVLLQDNVVAFDIASLNVSDNFTGGFSATFAFDSKYAPFIDMTTAKLGVLPQQFAPEEEALYILIIGFSIGAVIMIGFFYFLSKQEHKERLRHVDKLEKGFTDFFKTTTDINITDGKADQVCHQLIDVYKQAIWPKKYLDK